MATNVVLDTTMVSKEYSSNANTANTTKGSITVELYNDHAPKVTLLPSHPSSLPA